MFHHWSLIQQNAQQFLASGQEFKSFSRGNRYRITAVEEHRIAIAREEGYDGDFLTKQKAEEWSEKIRAQSSVPFRDVLPIVATRATLWMLHPNISLQNEYFVWVEDEQFPGAATNAQNTLIEEALDDDLSLEKKYKQVRERRNQSQFRKNLLKVYKNTCLISGPAPNETLVACHIYPYNAGGFNQTANGLLLRADIHLLFDAGLISIDPNTLQVCISKKFINSDYCLLDGKYIAVDAAFISATKSFLTKRSELLNPL